MYRKSPILYAVFFIFIFFSHGLTASSPSIQITGSVKQQLTVSLKDLERFSPVLVRLNEVTRDSNFHGAFHYRGVPLRTLLELADIQKKETDFFKAIDLAIVVKNKDGKKTVVSWGEVFYRNPAEIIIAYAAEPVMPHKSCQSCHKPEVYQPWLDQLNRKIGFPKLVVANDFYTDRSLENVTGIDVIDLHPAIKAEKMKDLYSPSFSISGEVKKTLDITDLSTYSHKEILVKQMGDGKGYHGLKTFEGVPLADLLDRAGIPPDLTIAFLVSAPDGYRSLLSYGEVILTPAGRNIVIADRVAGRSLKDDGKFILIPPDDLSADRWVKAVNKIEVIQLK